MVSQVESEEGGVRLMFRWLALSALVCTLGISTYYRRRARQGSETIPRSSERPLLILARVVLTLPLVGGILTYLVNPAWMEWASFTAPLWSRWAGVALGFLTVLSAYWVFSSIGLNISETVLTKEHHELVTHGPYRWIRHPLYTTGLALIVGIGLMAANWFILLYALVVLISVGLVVIPTEEQALLETFGVDYRDYMHGTGRIFPRVSGRV